MDDAATRRKLSDLLDVVLELAPTERDDWLAELETRDPSLARRLRSVLDGGAALESAGFLSDPLASRPQVSPLIGARIGPWIIEAEIGRGGMGSVWRARRADGRFEGIAAIKFVHLSDLGQEGELRFRREGQLLARLDHPHIARLIDAGVYEQTRQPYLVLDHVDGIAVDEWCTRRDLGLGDRLEIFLDIADAVAHAHTHLIVHRDLKPSNVLVTEDGSVKLLDFGIAKLAEEEASKAADATRSRVTVLTPQYAAPEQLAGGAVTTRTDVYGLGLLLFRLLTGTHATTWDGDRASLREALEREIPPPSRITTLANLPKGDLAGDLDNIVGKALRKDPMERYANASEIAADLRRHLRNEPVLARPATVPYLVRKFVRRHRGSVAGAALTALALVAATVITTHQMLEAKHQRDEARAQAERAQAQAEFTDQVITQLGDEGRPITRELILDRSAAFVEKNYHDRPKLAIGFYLLLSGRYMNLGATEKELAMLDRALGLARRAGDVEQVARVQCGTVETELDAGRLDRAAERLAEGRAALARLSGPQQKRRSGCLYAEAKLRAAEGKTADAIALATQAARLLEQVRRTVDLDYGSIVSLLVILNQSEQRLSEALRWNAADIAALRAAGRDGSEDMAFALSNRAALLADLGRPREARDLQRSVVRRLQSTTGVEQIHPGVMRVLGQYLARLEEFDEARLWLDRAVERAQTTHNVAFLVTALAARAEVRSATGDHAGARSDLTSAIAQAGANPPKSNRIAERLRIVEAGLLHAEQRLPEALDLARNLLAQRAAEQPPPPASMTLLRRAALLELDSGDPRSAAGHARAALDLSRRLTGSNAASADVGHACLLLAEALGAHEAARARALAAKCARLNLETTLGAEHSLTHRAQALATQSGG